MGSNNRYSYPRPWSSDLISIQMSIIPRASRRAYKTGRRAVDKVTSRKSAWEKAYQCAIANNGISKQIKASWIANARLSAVYFPFEGRALKNNSTARKNPCQYDAKITNLTVRNLGTGLNGFKSQYKHNQKNPRL